MSKETVGQILKKMGAVSDQQIDKALQFGEANDLPIGEALVKTEACSQEQVSRALAKHWELPFANLSKGEIKEEILALVPKDVALENNIVPVVRKRNDLFVAMSGLDYMVLDNLRFLLNQPVQAAIATPEDIEEALDHYYRLTGNLGDVLGDPDEVQVGRDEYAGEAADANEGPVIKYVTQLISGALKERASDIHIEPFEKRVRIRYRVDGVCIEKENPPKKLQGPILSRIKIMSDMDMAERRRPQDGRIKMHLHGREIDLRVSALPARHGESIVMRILDKEKSLVDLEELGFQET
ncbi:MAG: Flp pilus assembly complex ATPase component TadA, partial [Planctomycetes bacterium]|nr:Flp pilus assembly complex ATPase component TadA [Planctomycetota bacterium]